MVSDFGTTKYCKKCGLEIVEAWDCVTVTVDSRFCNCKLKEVITDGKM